MKSATTSVLLLLERRKVPINIRQQGAIIRAADEIMEELRRPDTQATGGCGLKVWLASDSTGLSSRYMARILATCAGLGSVPEEDDLHFRGIHYPHDPSDFGRCVGLLDAVPELRPHLPELTEGHGGAWARLVAVWDELEALYREELPTGKAPRLYARMREMEAKQ